MNSRKMVMVFRLLGVGWYIAICIGGGALIGVWLDGRTSLGPLFTLVGLGLGIAFGVIGMYRMLLAVLAVDSESETDNKG